MVVKVGTELLTRGGDALDPQAMSGLARQIAALREGGHEVLQRHIRAAVQDTPSALPVRRLWWWSLIPTLAAAAVGAWFLTR